MKAETELTEWEKIFRLGFHSNDYTLTEYLEKFYEPPRLKSHPEQGEQMAQDIMNILREHSTFVDGQIKALIVHGAIEKIVEYINGKLSSPPPEGQDELWSELFADYHTRGKSIKELSKQYLLIKK